MYISGDSPEMGFYISERAFLYTYVFTRCFFFLTSKKKVFKYSKLVKNAGMYKNFSSEMICIRCVAHFCLAHI